MQSHGHGSLVESMGRAAGLTLVLKTAAIADQVGLTACIQDVSMAEQAIGYLIAIFLPGKFTVRPRKSIQQSLDIRMGIVVTHYIDDISVVVVSEKVVEPFPGSIERGMVSTQSCPAEIKDISPQYDQTAFAAGGIDGWHPFGSHAARAEQMQVGNETRG